MSRTTSEEAVNMIGNKFDLILIASRRARELSRGWKPLVESSSSSVVTALKEIEAGKIGREYLRKPQNLGRRETPPTNESL